MVVPFAVSAAFPAARTRISNSRKRFTLGVESRGDARRTPCPCVDHAAYGGSA